MIRIARFLTAHFLRVAFTVSFGLLAGCSGSVSAPTTVNDPAKITLLPAQATLFSNLATTIVITGGNGTYVASSDNQAIIPIAGNVSGNTLLIVPNPVVVDTVVTLTVRDTGTTTPATATLTVKPGTVSNNITFTPSDTSCAPAICSGGDANVSATISQGGIPLAARGVRFDVISGDFRIITNPPGTPEILSLTSDVVSDQAGKAQVRIRVLSGAPNQIGLLKITDLGSGAFQQTTVAIAQFTGGAQAFFAIPNDIKVTGPAGRCFQGAISDVVIFGGSPPYAVVNTSSAFAVNPAVVGSSGGRFSLSGTGAGPCPATAPIAITDAAGRTISITVESTPGATPTPPPLVVAPSTVALDSCTAKANVTALGGSGTYTAVSGSSLVTVTQAPNSNVFSIQRTAATGPTTLTSVTVSITDGTSAKDVTVNLSGAGQGACP